LLEAAEFEAFVTGDRTLVHEQNLSNRRLAIIALSTNNWPIVKNYLRQIVTAIDGAGPGMLRRSTAVSSVVRGALNSHSGGLNTRSKSDPHR
jgi:hypothetical protein